MYLGQDEINDCYIGASAVVEAYLGEDLVFSSGPFVGLKVSPKTLDFFNSSLTGSIKIKCSESWSLTLPAWITASTLTGDTGETIVTLTATTQTAATSGVVEVTSTSFSAEVAVNYYEYEQLAYIEDGTGTTRTSDYCIDTLYVPTTASTVEISMSVQDADGAMIFATDNTSNGWWRIFTYSTSQMSFDCPSDYYRVSVPATISSQNTYKTWIQNGRSYIQLGENTPVSTSLPGTINFTTSLKLWGTPFDPNAKVGTRTKIYYIKIYEGQTLAMDLIPAKIGNDIGLYDSISGVLYTNSRGGQLTYGVL